MYSITSELHLIKYFSFLNKNNVVLYKYIDLLFEKIPKKYQKYINLDDFTLFIFKNVY